MRTYDHNGDTRPISHPEVSDEDVALQVAKGGWEIDIAARDRILCLAKEKQDLSSQRDELAKFLQHVRDNYDCECESSVRCRACDAEAIIAKLEGVPK